MATLEAIKRIRENLTPQVTLRSFQDSGEGILVEVKYDYRGFPIPYARVFKAKADKQGNILGMDDC